MWKAHRSSTAETTSIPRIENIYPETREISIVARRESRAARANDGGTASNRLVVRPAARRDAPVSEIGIYRAPIEAQDSAAEVFVKDLQRRVPQFPSALIVG
jgi:hypothetical protein